MTWRVVRGNPTPEELAAIMVVLTLQLSARAEAPAEPTAPGRPCRGLGWRTRSRPGWRAVSFTE